MTLTRSDPFELQDSTSHSTPLHGSTPTCSTPCFSICRYETYGVHSFISRGHSLEDLQHEVVKRAFQEQTINCPTQPTCTSTIVNKYRTADGSCNNVASPGWGQAGRPQLRIAPAAYGKFLIIKNKK